MDGTTEPTQSGSSSSLNDAMNSLRASDSTTSIDSGRTVIMQQGPLQMDPARFAKFQQFCAWEKEQEKNAAKRKRQESGQAGKKAESKRLKKRPSLSPEADALYKAARNALGRQARFHAQLLGLQKYPKFGDHLVPPTHQVSLSTLLFTNLYSPTQVSVFIPNIHCHCFTLSYTSLYFLLIQVRNSVPAGITDRTYLANHGEAIRKCEKSLLDAEIEYAQRMYKLNSEDSAKALSQLSDMIGADSAEYKDCLAAANRCADIHRGKEHQKQTKNWTEALSRHEAVGLGYNGRKGTQQKQKPKRSVAQQPQASSSGASSRPDNRPTLNARRRLPSTTNNTRGRHQAGNRRKNGGLNANNLQKAIDMVLSLDD